jgi:dsRNA-specific ribonuclease
MSLELQRKYWVVEVLFGTVVLGSGRGWEKRAAEQQAAREALHSMGEQ